MLQIGIDLGASHAKLAAVRYGLGRPRLVGTATVPIPRQSVTKAGLAHPEEVREAVTKGLEEMRLARAHMRVASALPASLVLTKRLELPAMSPAEITQAIPFEASQSFPVATEELVIDWLVLANTPDSGAPASHDTEPMVRILLVGAPRALVESVYEFFASLHLELVALEIKPLANARAVSAPGDQTRFLLVDIGSDDTSFTLIDRGWVSHIATVNFGGALAKENEAKPLLKTKTTIPTELLPPVLVQKEARTRRRTTNAKERSSQLGKRLQPLREEIGHVLAYASQHLKSAPVKNIRLCGGGADLPGITKALAAGTDLTIELANPFINFTNPEPVQSGRLALTTALGLALRKDD